MKSRDFCYWLQGLFELHKPKQLNEEQTELIRRHLAMVFKHEIDPSFDNAEELRDIHTPTPQSILKESLRKYKEKKSIPRTAVPRREPQIMC